MEDANLATMPFQEHRTESGGLPINYIEAGLGNTVVTLDSIAWGFSNLQNTLAQTYRVLVLELPGFGSSPVNNESSSAKELANVVAQATENITPQKFTLIGTSFSANVALWLAIQAPEQVEALVLISPTALHPLEMANQLLAHPERSPGLPTLPDILAKEQELIRRFGGGTHDAEVEGRLKEIQCPALVLFGSKDQLVNTSATSIYRREIPNCNVSIVYDAGHLIEAERPEALVKAVVDYVERRETFVVSRDSRVINP